MAQTNTQPAWVQGIEPGSVHDPFAVFFGEKSKEKSESSLRLWRVLDLQTASLLRITMDDLGERLATLFVDSSYFVLQTLEDGSANIFVWCGSEFLRAAREMAAESEDVEPTAAAVQRRVAETVYPLLHCLVSYLGSRWTLFYEVEGHECGHFMALFPLGIEYRLPQIVRGARLGRRLVEKVGAARLLRVKVCPRGSRSARISEVAPEAAALSGSGVVVLETFKSVFVWSGKEAGNRLRAKALQFALARKQIKENFTEATRVSVRFLIDGAEGSASAEDFSEFWKVLGSRPAALQDEDSMDDEGDDYVFPLGIPDLFPVRYKSSDGEVELGSAVEPPLSRKQLIESGMFVLCGGSGSFMWMGNKAPRSGLADAFAALALLHEHLDIPAWAPRCVLPQGNESVWFVGEFAEWPRVDASVDDTAAAAAHEAAEAAEAQSVVSEDGSVQMWRFRDAESGKGKVHVDVVAPEDFGQFYSAHSYVVCYVFSEKMQQLWDAGDVGDEAAAASRSAHGRRSRTMACVYFWEGRHASRSHRVHFQFRFAQKLLGRLESEYGLPPSQALLRQGHEPTHFLNVFLGDMMIYRGSVADELPETALFQILGETRWHTRTAQVNLSARALNSRDCFVLSTHAGDPPHPQYLWIGSGAARTPRRVDTATEIADFLLEEDQERVLVRERHEPSAFWKVLGGRHHYRKDVSSASAAAWAPRLFRVVRAGAEDDDDEAAGEFEVDELFSLRQDDLWDEDTMLLDLGDEVLVWVGSLVSDQSPAAALGVGQKYVAAYAGKRSADDVVVTQVMAGSEPPMFTAHFADWQSRKAEVYVDPLAKILRFKVLVDSGEVEDEDEEEEEEEEEEEGVAVEGEEGDDAAAAPPPPPPPPMASAAPAAGSSSARTLTGDMLGTVKLRATANVPPPKPDARVASAVPQLFDPSRIGGVKLRSAATPTNGLVGGNPMVGKTPMKVPSQKGLRKTTPRLDTGSGSGSDSPKPRRGFGVNLRPTARSAAGHDKSVAAAAAAAVATDRAPGGLAPNAAALRSGTRRTQSESAGLVAVPRATRRRPVAARAGSPAKT